MRLKINYRTSYVGRQMLRRWERERDLDALIELLENSVVPSQLLAALRKYREKAGTEDLETLLFRKRRGRGGNPAARSIARKRTEQSYAAILAAQEAGWRGGERFDVAARFMLQRGFLATRERTANGRTIHLTVADCAAKLARLYYRRRNRGPLDNFHKQLVLFLSGMMPLGPHAPKVNLDLVRKIAELKKSHPG